MVQTAQGMDAGRMSEIKNEISATKLKGDGMVDPKHQHNLEQGKSYTEMVIDFGKQEYHDQAFNLTLTGDDLPGAPLPPGCRFILNLKKGVKIDTAASWYMQGRWEGIKKQESGHFSVFDQVSNESTIELGVGLEATATISAKPLGVGGEFTVGASASFSHSIAIGHTKGSQLGHNITVNKGEGGQGWSRGGWVAANFTIDTNFLNSADKKYPFQLVTPPGADSLTIIKATNVIQEVNNIARGIQQPVEIEKIYPVVNKHLMVTYYPLN